MGYLKVTSTTCQSSMSQSFECAFKLTNNAELQALTAEIELAVFEANHNETHNEYR
jgi:hypothetical protein